MMRTMRSMLVVVALMATVVLTLNPVGHHSLAHAAETNTTAQTEAATVVRSQSDETADRIVDTYELSNGDVVQMVVDKQDDTLTVLTNGQVKRVFTAAEIREMLSKHSSEGGEVITASSSQTVPYSQGDAQTCSAVLGALGLTAGAIWTAAGVTAAAPPAAVVAAVADVSVSTVFWMISLMC